MIGWSDQLHADQTAGSSTKEMRPNSESAVRFIWFKTCTLTVAPLGENQCEGCSKPLEFCDKCHGLGL